MVTTGIVFALLSIAVAQAAELQGYLIDKQCLNLCETVPNDEACAPDGINVFSEPACHTKWCLLLQVCIDSGYTLLADQPDEITGRHAVLMDFSVSDTARANVLSFIQTGSTGTAPRVLVPSDV